ncbi:unnamed protein product [Fusarium fujikuroi]|nr:unnamed protein product [Fusarium fujikuroi]
MSGGHYSLDTSEVEEHQLQGKTNYIEWRRYFDRAAKGHDLWSLVTTESVLKEPKEEDYIAYFDVPYKGPSTRKKGEALRDDELKIDSNKSFFLWQAAYRRWERQKERVRLVRRLIAKSVVSSIANEIEDMASPLQQVNHIKNTYGVTDEYARSVLLDKITALKLSHCSSMSDYINQHRDLKTDLVRAGLPYSDSQMATNLIHGLPKSYNDFTKLWNFHRSQAIGTEPDIHFLLDRLLNEEASHEQEKSGGNKNKGGTAPKNNKVCTHKDCGKPGHEEKDCWIAHPEKMPQRIKDKQKENSSSGDTPNKSSNKQPDKPKGIVAMAKSAGALHDAMVSHTSNSIPYAHYMGGTHERVNRIIREKAAPMIQEQSISGQLTKIITGKALETIQETKLPENLWVEAMRYSVWLKNRSPTRALKDKTTPWEAVYGIKPIFGRESIWGSRIYVTLPPETDRVGKPKLHHARGWVGYFVGCDSESIYRIYSDEHHRVFRVGVGRIQQGQGVEDEHDGLSYNDRVGREGSQIPIIPSPSSIQEESSQDNQPDDQAIDNFWHESDSDRSDPANPSEHACEDDWETDEEEEGDEHHEPHGQSSDKNLPDNPPSSESYHSSDNNVFEKSKYFAAVLQLPQDYKPPDSSDESDTEQHNDKSQIVKREMRLLAPGTEILDEPCYFCYVYGRRSGKNCAYIVQQGLMEKFYPVTQAAKDKFKSYSEDSCRWCIVTPSARCDTEQPCRICVMACARLTYTRCVYRREDHLEKYSASAFMLDSNGRVVLKENWEDFTINKINALHAKNWDKKKNTPLTEKHLHSSITLNADADTATVTVPDITSQIPQHPPPTFQELRDIFSGPEMTSRNEAAGLHNSNNLTADQVAGVLQIWGNSRNLSLQLGVLIDGGEHLIIRGPENSRTIWIHNDNANEGNPDTFNHYSGVDIPTHAQSDNNLSDSDSHSDFQPENDIDDDITFFSSNKHVLHVQKDLASEPEPTTYAAAMKCAESSHWERAIYAEKQNEIATKLRMKLEDSFQMKDEGLCEWYLGMHVLQDENGVTIHQEKYINQMLRRFDLDNIKSKSTPLTAGLSLTKNSVSESNEDLITDYQQKVGSLIYVKPIKRSS